MKTVTLAIGQKVEADGETEQSITDPTRRKKSNGPDQTF
jgi:hypothetical protein